MTKRLQNDLTQASQVDLTSPTETPVRAGEDVDEGDDEILSTSLRSDGRVSL
jgi:hypothetical protein